MPATVVIDERFCGPARSANGGYACAMTAAHLDGPAEVTLRVPPPLGRELTVASRDEQAFLLDGDVTVAEGRAATVDVEIPEPVFVADAQRAAATYPWRDRHPYPTCFVCGPEREAGDALCIFPGPVEGRELYAAPWTPHSSLANDAGDVRDEFVWAALDCPSGIVTDLFGDVGRILLGRLAADLKQPAKAGREHVVQAWPVSLEGRKLHTASALFNEEGKLCAVARALWIEVAR
jgi:hypothetical protein